MLNLNVNAKYIFFVVKKEKKPDTHIAEKCVLVVIVGEHKRSPPIKDKTPNWSSVSRYRSIFSTRGNNPHSDQRCRFSWCLPQKPSCTRNGRRRNVGVGAKTLCLFDETVQHAISNLIPIFSSFFSVMVHRHKYTWCKICKKKKRKKNVLSFMH